MRAGVQATEENRQLLRQQLPNQEIRKVLIKAGVPVTDEETLDKILYLSDRLWKNSCLLSSDQKLI